jgi:hypothetical protein
MATPATKQLTPVPRRNRMTLEAVIGGKIDGPVRVLIHGVDGVGKSTFGADAPKPIFLGTEDGTEHLDVARFPAIETWPDVLDAIQTLTSGEHDYQTLVVDSLDWAEPYLHRHICQRHGVTSVEEIGGGYGKWVQVALDEWRIFIAAIERMQRERKMGVILIAHSFIKSFKDPLTEGFDRYVLKLNDKAAGLMREWCKGVYFANYETFAVKDKNKRVRGVSTGARLLYTKYTAGFDAKDRYGLPETIPLSWEEFDRARRAGAPADPVALVDAIRRKAAELGGELEQKALGAIERAEGDVSKLARINDWANAKLGLNNEQKGEQQ